MNETTHVQDKDKDNTTRSPISIESLVAQWNQIEGVQHVRDITASRREAFRTRAKKAKWLAELPAAIETMGRATYGRGQPGQGGRSWRADLDWLLKPDSVTKILEGKYGGNVNGQAVPTPERVPYVAHGKTPEECGLTRKT